MRLNVEQRKIVEHVPSGHLQVKGVAGSGKTTICVQRIPFLLNHYCHSDDDKLIMVTYNKTLLNFIKHQYENLDEEAYSKSLFAVDESKMEMINIDRLMFRYFNDYLKRNKMNLNLEVNTKKYLSKAIHFVKEKYPNVKIIHPKHLSFFNDEIDWIKACDIDTLDIYQNVARMGRASGIAERGSPQKLVKNSTTREAIYKLKEIYDDLLYKDGKIDFKTMNLLALEEARLQKPRYTHILIDECQDLTKVQLEFMKELYQEKSYSSIMFVADNTQSIYSHSWLGKGRPYTSIGIDMRSKSKILSKNYRTTTEISQAAFSLIEKDNEIQDNIDFVKPSLIDRHGNYPVYRHFKTDQDQLNFVLNTIHELKGKFKLSDICILAKTNTLLNKTEAYLVDNGIPAKILDKNKSDFFSQNVKLTTMHSIKGLEFKVIFLIDLNQGVIPNNSQYITEDNFEYDADERRLLYVGMTRANNYLFMSSVNKASRFIKDIDNKYLRYNLNSKLSPFRPISVDDYVFKNKIIDYHSNEEMVRQWLLNELIRKYKYPLDLLEIEYPVQQFSRQGYVDVCVKVFVEGIEQEFIFIELKQWGSGIETGLKQLKSYMQTSSKVHYGMVTDGIDLLIIDKEGQRLDDIPSFQAHFLPDKKNKKVYSDLISNKQYEYIQNEDVLEVYDLEKEMFLDSLRFIEIPLLEAGMKQNKGMIKVPKTWIESYNNPCFLEMTSDSMIDIGIEQGDLLLLNQQNIAKQGDIVLVLINDELSFKEYLSMGSDVILLSKNIDYEPITMRSEDVFIHAKVLGFLKQ